MSETTNSAVEDGSSLRSLFLNRGVYPLVLILTMLSVLRGIRLPNLWEYTQFLFNYEFGFVKRGLIGEILRRLDSPWFLSYEFYFLFSVFICLVNLALFFFLVRGFFESKNSTAILAAIVFAASLGVVSLGNYIGIADQLGLMILFLSLGARTFFKRWLVLMTLMPLSLLIHEGILIMFFPVALISLVLAMDGQRLFSKQSVQVAAFILVSLLTTWVVSQSTIGIKEANQMKANLEEVVGHKLHRPTMSIMYWEVSDHARNMKDFRSAPWYWGGLSRQLMVTLPTALFFIFIMVGNLRAQHVDPFIIFMATMAALSPLVLHVVAWDTHRWNMLTITTSFLALSATYRVPDKVSNMNPSSVLCYMAIALIYLNGISTIPLRSTSLQDFPFTHHYQYLDQLGHQDFTLWPW